MTSTPVYPQLAGVITLSDVKQKGTGSYAADYVAWAKVMQLINQHANGWLPELILTADDSCFVHRAPDGTGYLCIQFVNGNCSTPIWPFPITDARNNAIPYDKISARNFTDSHRRGICSAAAAFFSLAFELWAREEVAASAESVETQPEIQLQQDTPKPAPKAAGKRIAKPANDANASAPSADSEANIKQNAIDQCVDLIQSKLDRMQQIAWIADKATKWDLEGSGSKLAQMTIDQLLSCIDELKGIPNVKK
jgi:hypothetical protein